MDNIPQSDIIEQVRLQKYGLLEKLDDRYRHVFLAWAGKRFVATPNDLEDAWQEALVLLYEKAISGKMTHLKCSVQTWLFAVGGNHLRNLNRKMRRVVWHDEADKVLQAGSDVVLPEPADDGNRELLQTAIEQLSTKCRDLLRARYYDDLSIPEIRDNFQFGSDNSTSVQLSKCFATLKAFVQKTYTTHGT